MITSRISYVIINGTTINTYNICHEISTAHTAFNFKRIYTSLN